MSSELSDRPSRASGLRRALRDLADRSRELVEQSRDLKAEASRLMEEKPCWDADCTAHEARTPEPQGGPASS